MVIAREPELAAPHNLARLMGDQEVTIWGSVPAAMRSIVAQLCSGFLGNQLRSGMLSGDFIPWSLPDAVRQHFPGARVMCLGGAAEASIGSKGFPCDREEPSGTRIPYGVPIQNAWYHRLGENMKSVPHRCTGRTQYWRRMSGYGSFESRGTHDAMFCSRPIPTRPAS